ncbi:hypothetical protein BKI52_08620 [marine bacterium AO1-C]|nr:hypothetical protein BKI52_08620 [marine bacterium AO1-C]
MAYTTLILDFDGTIANTQKSIVQTMQYVASSLNITEVDEALIKKLIGLPLKTTFEKALLLDEESIEQATTTYRQHYNDIAIDTIDLFEGVADTLRQLHEKGIHLNVASSKGRESLVRILKKQNVYELFSFVGGEEDAKSKKPSPEIVNLIIDKFGRKLNECLVVGDTIFDIEMGQRAKVDTCGVTYGNGTSDELKKQNPNYLIDQFESLLKIV